MDRRSVIVAGTLGALLLAAIGVGIVLSIGGSGNKAVVTPPGSSSSTSTTPTFPTSTTAPPVAPQTVPTLPKPTVVIQTPPSTRPASTTPPPPTTTPARGETGITAHEIRISVVADDVAVAHGVQAWALATNQAGGLAGRQVRVDVRTVTSAASYAGAVSTACQSSYAVVGSSSQFDSQAGPLACGIPELATRIYDQGHRGLPNAFAVLPAKAGVERVGAFRQVLKSGCCRQYVLVPTTDPGRTATTQSLQAAAAIGFTTAGTPDVGPGADYAAIVADLVAKGATFARSGLGADSTVQLRKAAAANPGATGVTTWYCDSRCDDPAFLASGGTAVEGQLIDDAANSLLDQHSVPAIATYARTVRRLGAVPTQAGVESYAAGMLFDQAVRQVVASSGTHGLTRARLLSAVGAIHDFNAAGILGPTDVGARAPNGCFQLLKVASGHFDREFPTTPGTLDCHAQNLQTVP